MLGAHLQRQHSPPMWPALYSFQSSPKTATLTAVCEVDCHPCSTHGEVEAQRVTPVAQSPIVSDGGSNLEEGRALDRLVPCPRFTDEEGEA